MYVPEASAHVGASGIVKERMDAMEETGDDMKAINPMVKGRRTMDLSELAAFSTTIHEHALKVTSLFSDSRASRTGHETGALPEI
jgi:cytochrome c556